MKLSISDLELYMQCPRSYKLHILDGKPPEHKSLSLCKAITARKVISMLHGENKNLLDFSSEEIERLCDAVWQEEIADPSINTEELNAIVVQEKPATKSRPATAKITKGERILENIKTWAKTYAQFEHQAKILYSNIYFEDQIGDTKFSGLLDQIRETPEHGIQIVCFNTSSQAPQPLYIVRDFHISLYSHALWQGKLHLNSNEETRLNRIPTACYYYLPYLETYKRKNGNGKKGDLKGDPVIPASRSKETLLNFEYEILYAVTGIQIGLFPMNINRIGCSLCQFAYRCESAVENQILPKIPEYAEISIE